MELSPNNPIKIPAEFLPKKGGKAFVACSGGVDSMVLLHALKEHKIEIEVLHVNYGLRAEDSEKDELLVKVTAKAMGIKAHVLNVNLATQLESEGGNLQDEARKLRYEFFANHLNKNENSILYTGHHLDDQIETFVMRLMRNSGMVGLSGIPAKRGRIYRPFLGYEKAHIRSFAKENSIEFREDKSNLKNNYLRNKLRNEILPVIYDNTPNNFKSAVQILQNAMVSNIDGIIKTNRTLIEKIKNDGVWSFEDFDKLSFHELHVVFNDLTWPSYLIERLVALRTKERSKLVSTQTFTIVKGANEFIITANEVSRIELRLKIEQVKNLPLRFNKESIFLDKQKIKGSLQLRKWETGDRISSLGIDGSQLISDILKDAKVDALQKDDVYVLHDEHCIHWCVGFKIGRIAIADSKTNDIILVTAQKL